MIENDTVLQDRYLIEKQIGAGGMGAVYLAVDQRFGSHVALKETFYSNDEFGDAFEREAHLLNSLHHPALPHVSDYFTENNGHFLVMQFIDGEDLSAILKREGSFPVKDVLRWTDSLLDALDYLHSQEPPIIHRDIKPQNLKITPRGEIILLDFGLAKLKSEDTSSVKSVFGYSRKYSPLEQIQGTGTDARSDIFSLAATGYHLLTGKPPVDVLARAAEIVVGNPDPLPLVSEINPDVSVEVANILNSALALNSAARFVSALAMRQALTNAVNIEAGENKKEFAEAALPVEKVNDAKVVSLETENFPALQAFAAEAASGSTVLAENIKAEAVDYPNTDVITPLPAQENLLQSNDNVEEATKIAISPYRKKYKFPMLILVTLLICVGLATGYFINKANFSNDLTPAPPEQPVSGTNAGEKQSEVVLEQPKPEVAENPILENQEQAKNKAVSTDKVVEKKVVDEPVVSEKPERNLPIKTDVSRSAPIQNKRKTQTPTDGEIRDRVVGNQPVPDIESIFTGRPSQNKNERMRRQENRQTDEMSEAEWQEFRRQRREARRRRQNNRPLPF